MAKKRAATKTGRSQKMSPVVQFGIVFVVVGAMLLLFYAGKMFR